MSIGSNIKRYRVRKNMTQAELAEAIGVTLRMLQKYEAPEETNTSVIPSIITLRKIAEILQIKASYLIEEDQSDQQMNSISDFYEVLAQNFHQNMNSERTKSTTDNLIYFIYKNIYDEYKLEEHTGMNASKFFGCDSLFGDSIYKNISSYIIGATVQNILKIKLGEVKSKSDNNNLYKNFDNNWDTINMVINVFAEQDKLDDLLKYTLKKMQDYDDKREKIDI